MNIFAGSSKLPRPFNKAVTDAGIVRDAGRSRGDGLARPHATFYSGESVIINAHMQIHVLLALTTARGFEPLRAEPNGFLVHHLNHSVTLSMSFVVPGMTHVENLQTQRKCGK